MTVKEAAMQQTLLSNGFAKKRFPQEQLSSNNGTVFSVQFMPRCYKQES
jgi:hypothetical protein